MANRFNTYKSYVSANFPLMISLETYQISISNSEWQLIHHNVQKKAKQFVTYTVEEAINVYNEPQRQETMEQILSRMKKLDKLQFLCCLAPRTQKAMDALYYQDATIASIVSDCKIPLSNMTAYLRMLPLHKFQSVASLLFVSTFFMLQL